MAQPKDSSILTSALWMIGISLLLFFLPAINGLIGGAVGGYKAGSAARGASAAVLPAVVVGLLLWGIFALFNAPVVGFFGGLAVGLWALISSLGLVIGAALGGAAAPNRPEHIDGNVSDASNTTGYRTDTDLLSSHRR